MSRLLFSPFCVGLLFCGLFFLTARANATEQPPVSGKIEAVTVYLQGAKLTGSATTSTPAGVHDIVVTDLTNNAVQQSLQVTLRGTGVQLLSATYRVNQLKEIKVSARLQTLRDSLAMLSEQKQAIVNQIATDDDEMAIIKNTAEHRLGGDDKGASFEDVQHIAEYYQKHLNEVRTHQQHLKKQLALLTDTQNKIEYELGSLHSRTVKAVGEIVLKVKANNATTLDIGFSIVTNAAAWSPVYDLKATTLDKPVQLVYKANIVQATGYDWTGVKLLVSTGNPNSNNSLPLLVPRYLTFAQPLVYYDNNNANGYSQMKQEAPMQLQEKADKKAQLDDSKDASQKLVDGVWVRSYESDQRAKLSSSIQTRGSRSGEAISYSDNNTPRPEDAGVSTELTITEKQDIPTDGQPHLVQIDTYDVPAQFEYQTVPLKEQAAFLLAKVTNFGQYNLVQGNANIFFGDTYIGQSFINPYTLSDTLLLSLGRDDKVSIKREKLKDFSATRFLSNYKNETIAVEISVRNNKTTSIDIEVLDNIPVSQEKDIEVRLEEQSGAKLTADSGQLFWSLTLKAGETRKLKVVYTLSYPKDKKLAIDNILRNASGVKGMLKK